MLNSFPDPFLPPRPDPTNQRPRRVTPSESARLLCCANPSRSSGHEIVQRCVLNLSSIPHDVIDLSSTSIDVLNLSFPLPRGLLTQVPVRPDILDRPPVIWHPALFEHSCISRTNSTKANGTGEWVLLRFASLTGPHCSHGWR